MNLKMIEMAIKEFGLTDKANKAGFLLENGEMLKFEYLNHEEIYRVVKNFVSEDEIFLKEDAIDIFIKETNSIRLVECSMSNHSDLYLYFHIDQKVSNKQWRKLFEINEFHNNSYISFDMILWKGATKGMIGIRTNVKNGDFHLPKTIMNVRNLRLLFNKVKKEGNY